MTCQRAATTKVVEVEENGNALTLEGEYSQRFQTV